MTEVCDGCFLECERRGGAQPYPCSEELRKWARGIRFGGAPMERVGEGRWERRESGDDRTGA